MIDEPGGHRLFAIENGAYIRSHLSGSHHILFEVLPADAGVGGNKVRDLLLDALEIAKSLGCPYHKPRHPHRMDCHTGCWGDEGLLGMACTNSEAIMVPTFGKKAMLGSNPIAVAMPAEPYPFLFDCSTTVVTRGKLEMYNKMEKPLPEGWALDKDGKESTDAPDVLSNIVAKRGGGIMPLGGNKEVNGSHKGYGYGMLCELFSSILSQGVTSDKCCTFKDKTGICHGFIAVNPAIFGNPEEIKRHFSEYLEALRESPKADGAERIYTHGEKEVLAKKDRLENGIQVNDNTMAELANLCEYLKLDFNSYFKGYQLQKDSRFFEGNY